MILRLIQLISEADEESFMQRCEYYIEKGYSLHGNIVAFVDKGKPLSIRYVQLLTKEECVDE